MRYKLKSTSFWRGVGVGNVAGNVVGNDSSSVDDDDGGGGGGNVVDVVVEVVITSIGNDAIA